MVKKVKEADVVETPKQYYFREGEASIYYVDVSTYDKQGNLLHNEIAQRVLDHADPDVPQELKDLDTMVSDYWAANIAEPPTP